MKQKIMKILIFEIALLIISGCQSEIIRKDGEMCIQPPFKLAIPEFVPMSSDFEKDKVRSPGNGWKEVTRIPEGYKTSNEYGKIIFSKGKIWTSVKYSNPDNVLDNYFSIGTYNIKQDTWKIYDEIANYKNSGPYKLLVDHSGSIYGLDYYDKQKILISTFDEGTDLFIPIYQEINATITDSLARDFSIPIVDSSGNIWFNLTVDGGQSGLYKFNPSEKQLTYSQPYNLDSIYFMVLAPNNRIWMIAKPQDSSDDNLYEWDPVTGEMNINYKSYLVERGDFLYFDRESNLWISDKGFMNFSQEGKFGTFYEIIRSPVFITKDFVPDDRYKWLRPNEMFQSSDGTYWFSAPGVGIVKLKKNSEEWCLFTNGVSQVIEDDNKNVWIIIENILYKKKIY